MSLLSLIPSVLGIGSALFSGNQQKKAADKALDAQNAAAQQQLAAQEAARQQQVQINQPYVQGGYSALDAILQRYNLGPSSSGAPPSGAVPADGTGGKTPGGMSANYGTPQGGATGPYQGALPGSAPQPAQGPAPGSPDWAGFLQANPDIAEYYAKTPEAQTVPLEQFAQQVYQQQGDVRNPPPVVPAAGPATTTSDGYVPIYNRPDQPTWQGAGAAPSQADFLDPSKFTTSPGYEFRLNEGNRNVNAKFGAKGLLKSGSALKGFDDYNQGMASNEFGNWFNQQKSLYDTALGQYNQDRSANYNIFNTERNNTNQNFADDRSYGTNLGLANRTYDTSVDNTRIGNLFSLVNTGQSAANSTGQAAQTYANNAGNIYGSQAAAAADAAASRAGANIYGANAVGTAAGNIFAGAPRVANSNTSGQVQLGTPSYSSIFGSAPRVVSF